MMLTELLIAVTIVAALAAGIQPAAGLLTRLRVRQAAAALETSLRQAQIMAQTLGTELIVCARDTSASSDQCDSAHRWHNGWLLMPAGTAHNKSTPWLRHPPLPAQVAILGSDRGPPPAVALRFGRRGTISAGGRFGTSASFLLCPADEVPACGHGRLLSVSHGGQIHTVDAR